jgi:hypothetical protein
MHMSFRKLYNYRRRVCVGEKLDSETCFFKTQTLCLFGPRELVPLACTPEISVVTTKLRDQLTVHIG